MPWNAKGASRAGSEEMSRGSDVAEGTLPFGAVLFKVLAGATLETSMMVEDPWVDWGLSSKRSGPFRGLSVRGVDTGEGVGGGRAAFSCRRKDGRNHPSKSREIEGRHSGASTNWRGYRARTLRQSGDRWHGGDGINLVDGVRWGRDDGWIRVFEGDPSVGV